MEEGTQDAVQYPYLIWIATEAGYFGMIETIETDGITVTGD